MSVPKDPIAFVTHIVVSALALLLPGLATASEAAVIWSPASATTMRAIASSALEITVRENIGWCNKIAKKSTN